MPHLRTLNCYCDKGNSYSSETTARAAAATAPDRYGQDFRVYRCSGSLAWHIATRGFHPDNLRSKARIAAFYLRRDTVWDRDELARTMNIALDPEGRPHGRFRKTLRQMHDAGLVARNTPHPGQITALDPAGLLRVIEVGLEYYLHEQANPTT